MASSSSKGKIKGRQALGRGLSALLPAPEAKAQSGASQREVPLDSIHPNPAQPRKHFDDSSLAELAATLADMGVLQPLLVRRLSSGYELISGERRWRAAKLAGLQRVPVEVLDVDEVQGRLMALVENLQREDLTLLEEAEAYRQLVADHGLTQEEVASRVGKDRSTVANALRILKLPSGVKEALARGLLSPGHARALLGLPEAQIEPMSRKVIRQGLNVRATEKLVKGLREGGSGASKGGNREVRSAEAASLEAQLVRALGTRVVLREKKKGQGRIEISYHSYDELNRLLDMLIS
ncbi:MAG: ParB/RepB/Spo0J family partition protein [Polyangia bacterium]|jgi:ParB family chromosome partitioning protein|nr:ParB/RepB/Spo0J family partition protein [Polyangia bacterium]